MLTDREPDRGWLESGFMRGHIIRTMCHHGASETPGDSMETLAHQNLKRLASTFLRSNGCLAYAHEVRCPISRYLVDCAGYKDRDPAERRRCPAETILVECKQSRSDFLRDRQSADRLLALRAHLIRVQESIERERIVVEEPHLRRTGSSLFAELDDWDFAGSRLPCYRRVQRQLRRLDEQLYGETKFYLVARYQLADRLFLAAPRGMIRPCELPRGWGLLDCPPRSLDQIPANDRLDEPPALSIRIEGPQLQSKPEFRLRLLRNIAVAATKAATQRGSPVSSLRLAAAAG
jgi:hypothetical protein